ncbi:MAG TPA: ABC transporter permease [Coriobacteriia bacterium]
MKDGFVEFVRKEAVEILRTWRIWVLPGMALFFAISGPALAKFTPQILQAVAGMDASAVEKLMGGAPSFYASYGQWIKNLSQVVFFAVLIIYGGIVSSERTSGTAILVLTKPVSRTAFVVAKYVVHALFLAAILVIGTLVTWGLTALVFGQAPGQALWQASLSWLVLAWFFLALMTLLSVLLSSQAGAAGAGVGAWAVLALLSMSPWMVLFTPAGLIVSPAAVAAGAPFPSVWPVVGSLVGAGLLVWWATAAFTKQEL